MTDEETKLAEQIEARITAEYRKHKDIDWTKIASIKIAHMIAERMPTEEEIEEWMRVNPFGSAREFYKWFRSRMEEKK
jgi:hypothetical protein